MWSSRLQKGFSLIESLVGVAIFTIIAVSAYQAYLATLNAVHQSRLQVTATALANEQFEIVRNLPYVNVGIVGGVPNGRIPSVQNLVRDGIPFLIETAIRNVDDPFDGLSGGFPPDSLPADYRLVEITISCPSCHDFAPLQFTTQVGPRALESTLTDNSKFLGMKRSERYGLSHV